LSYPQTLAALREQENRSWAVADALAAEIKTHPEGRVLNGEYDRCQAWLAQNGYEVTTDYLSRMREVSMKFPLSESRKWRLPFRLYMAAAQSSKWSPGLMEQAELNGWTLRQFSEQMTGKRWADDDMEAARRVLKDPAKSARLLDEDPELFRAADQAVGEATHRRITQGRSLPPMPERRPTTNAAFAYLMLAAGKLAIDAKDLAKRVNALDGPLPTEVAADMVDDCRITRSAIDWIEAVATRGKATDWDDELRTLNAQGGA
jgi:hypothetical protein